MSSQKIGMNRKLNENATIYPCTFKVYNNLTKRIWYSKRQKFELSIMILVFDGMMGEFKLGTDHETQLFIRVGLVDGLKNLSTQFHLVIYSAIRDELRLKFLIQSLRKKKVPIDGIYKKLVHDKHDIYEQIYFDYGVDTNKVVVVSPYYSEDGFNIIHSYSHFNHLHTMFNNITARERLSDSADIPL